jgi:hypothetical protein
MTQITAREGINVVATLTGCFPTFCRRHRLTKIRKAVDSAYFALPPLAAFLVGFFLAIVPPFPEDGTPNARRQLMLPTKSNRRHHS